MPGTKTEGASARMRRAALYLLPRVVLYAAGFALVLELFVAGTDDSAAWLAAFLDGFLVLGALFGFFASLAVLAAGRPVVGGEPYRLLADMPVDIYAEGANRPSSRHHDLVR